MEIHSSLLHNIRAGEVVLVLGAGASIGASNPNGMTAPTSKGLTRMLADRFLGGDHSVDSLASVAELAVSESGLFPVQEFIREIFQDIEPADFHMLLPTFKWAAIATTNFDLIIERAYERCANRSQNLVPLIRNGDVVEEKIKSPRNLMLLKLHGCITLTSDSSLPLILSVDQYITHRSGRDRLFEHFKDLFYEKTLVFVGHSLNDPDIRQLLLELGSSTDRPRYYTVIPEFSGHEQRLWDSRRITPIKATFEDFLTTVDQELPSAFRGIAVAPILTDLPISERFIVRNPGLSQACLEFLENDVEYVRAGMPIENLDSAQLFYLGFSPRWSAVESALDVPRDLQDTIMTDVVLDSDSSRTLRFCSIKGHAGSGKSVLLQRLAWEAAQEYNRLCLFLQPHGNLSYEALSELSDVTDERIYLFVDDIGDRVPQMLHLIERARRSQIQLTILAAERINEWNMSCVELEPYLTHEFEVQYLSSNEIDRLLDLLEKHHALFTLKDKSNEERKTAFVEKAGRQLLVALHEATLGKPFEDIIADEFDEITPELAKSIYLGVCFLNRYDVPVRAGLINRIFGIKFTDFRARFFKPLQSLVFTRYDPRTRDNVYVTRHPHIAEIVVDRALVTTRHRLDTHLQMLGSMNIDYDADRTAFRKLVRGRTLHEQFPDHQMVNAVYNACYKKFGVEPYLLQQEAIYEMHRSNGNLTKADELLNKARLQSPRDKSIVHSLAELQLRRFGNATSPLEAEALLREAERLARPLASPDAVNSYGFNTIAKVQLERLRALIAADSSLGSEFAYSDAVKSVEEVIQQGIQKFPGDTYLLDLEAQLGTLLADDDRSIAALESAFKKAPQSPFVAVRLAKLLLKLNRDDEAVKVYRTSIESGGNDKQVHFNYAKLLIDRHHPDFGEIEYHLRRGFTDGDTNIEAQFWFARQLYLGGKIEQSRTRFTYLKGLSLDPKIKREIRGIIVDAHGLSRFSGRVDRLEYNYGFIAKDGTGDHIFFHKQSVDSVVWENLSWNSRVSFAIGFNFFGSTAIEVIQEY